MVETQVKVGELYWERKEGVKAPGIVRVRKIAKIGPFTYVFFTAENPAAQAIYPNGGFIPLDSFLTVWAPHDSQKPR